MMFDEWSKMLWFDNRVCMHSTQTFESYFGFGCVQTYIFRCEVCTDASRVPPLSFLSSRRLGRNWETYDERLIFPRYFTSD